MVGPREKLEYSVGVKVMIFCFTVLTEGEARLAGTGRDSWFSGLDIILSGLTCGEELNEKQHW